MANQVEATSGRWNTERIDALMKSIEETGVIPKNNPFYMGDPGWRKDRVNFTLTDKEYLEFVKISTNILHFAENYAKVLTDEGEKIVKLRKYQIKVLLQLKKYRHNVYLASRQCGKCVDYTTEIDYYDKKSDKWNRKPIFEFYYANKKELTFFERRERFWYRRMLTVDEAIRTNPERKYFLKGISWLINKKIEVSKYFRLKLWKFDLNHHEILDSVIPKGDSYVKSISDGAYITAVHLKKKYQQYYIKLDNGLELYAADDHLIYLTDGSCKKMCEINKKDIILTENGGSRIRVLRKLNKRRHCFDLTVNSEGNSYFTNGILSHNSIVSGIFIVWYMLTNESKNVVLTSQTGEKVKDLMEKIETIMKHLPFWLKLGMVYKNVFSMKFDNNVKLQAGTTTENTAAGVTAHLFYSDEFALIHRNFIKKFFRTVFPTLSSSEISKMIITSTPRGKNKFYEIYSDAVAGKNNFNPIRTDWYEVPKEVLEDGTVVYRDEEWKQEMIADLGSEEDFNQEFGNQFVAGNSLLFQSHLLRKLKKYQTKFVHRECPDLDDAGLDYKGYLLWHPKFDMDLLMDESSQFVVSIDLAEGSGAGDFSVLNIFQIVPKTLKEINSMEMFTTETDFFKMIQVGVWRSNDLEIPELSMILYHLVTQVMIHENVKGVLEMNYEGNYLREKVCNLYGYKNEMEDDHFFVRFPYNMIWQDAITFKVGIRNNAAIKATGCKVIKDKIKHNDMVIMEENTVEEAVSFAKNNKGGYEGQSGNDDAMMTCVNIVHYYESGDYIEQIEELLENAPEKFIEIMDEKLEKQSDDEFGDDDDEFEGF